MDKKKILIIDDSELVLEIYSDLLKSRGFDVVTRNTPFGTAAAISSERPHLVLLDIFMPGLAGNKLVEAIRMCNTIKDTTILLFSDRPIAELESVASSCGADGFLRKTKDHEDFVGRMMSYLPMNQ